MVARHIYNIYNMYTCIHAHIHTFNLTAVLRLWSKSKKAINLCCSFLNKLYKYCSSTFSFDLFQSSAESTVIDRRLSIHLCTIST